MPDTSADAVVTAETSVQLSKSGRFGGRENKFLCFQGVFLLLLEVCTKYSFSLESNIVGCDEVFDVRRLFLKEMVALESKRRPNS